MRADMMLLLAGDAEIEYVQGTIVCEDEDWEGQPPECGSRA